MTREEIKTDLKKARVIAILRASSAETLEKMLRVYVDGGIKAIELTTSIPDWNVALANAVDEFGGFAHIGLGTVTSREDALRAIELGAEFIVSPFVNREVIKSANEKNIVVIPGALTPSEIAEAYSLGADLVKVFPASSVGGPKYIKALLGPMPSWELIPTGGVTPENAIEYFRAGAVTVGLGTNLTSNELIEVGDWFGVRRSINEFLNYLNEQLEEPVK